MGAAVCRLSRPDCRGNGGCGIIVWVLEADLGGRGLKVNLEKTKMIVTGGEMEDVIQVGRRPCRVCGRGDGANSVLRGTCGIIVFGHVVWRNEPDLRKDSAY